MISGDSGLAKVNSKWNLQPSLELKIADFLINQTIEAAFCLGETAQFLYVNNLQQEGNNIQPQHIDNLLQLRESRFCTLLEATKAGIFLIQGRKIYYVNSAAELLTGYTKKELLADFDFNQLIKSRTSKPPETTNLEFEYQEINIITKDGKERWLDVAMTRFDGWVDFDGQEVEVLTATDITDYKFAQLELHQALEQAQEISKIRANLVGILCHEFRTPLNVISFSNSLLKRHIDKWETDKKLIFIEHIQTAVEQINQVLDNILLLSKAESAQIIVEPQKVNIVKFCQDLITQMVIIDSNKYINFQSQGNCLDVWIDQKILKPILNNLLDNAIKYSPPSSVVDLTVSCHQEKIQFQVKDKGIGIPEIDQQRLFEPFYRGSNVDNTSGTGLGLSIVKNLVDLYGGQITMVSKVGVGTTFTLVLPSVPIFPSS